MNYLKQILTVWAFSLLLLAGPAIAQLPEEDEAAKVFEARFAGQQTVDGENALAVNFSLALDAGQDLNPFFTLATGEENKAVEGAWILGDDPTVAYFTHIDPDTTYRIRVLQGLKAGDGSRLEDEVTYEITTRSAEPMISFGSQGFILASKLTKGLPVDSLNISQADIDFFRVRPDKTGAFKEQFWSNNYLYYYDSRDLTKMADLVYSGRWDLDIKKDLRTQVNIPVTHIQALKQPGIYFAVLKEAGHYDYGYNTTWFTISDLGVHARIYGRGLNFYVQSLETAAPVRGARVEGFDKKGNSLFSLDTDGNGQAEAPGRFEALSLVSVTRGDHTTLLPMDVPAMDLSEFKTGTMPHRPVALFVYGPRDIYRPGETVFLDGLLRNQDGAMTPGVPVKAKVIRPDGRMIREFTWKPGAQNHFYTDFQLPANALTGRWRVVFTHGTGRLEEYRFIVSEFLPERMKLDIGAGGRAGVISPGAALEIPVQGDFLYGAPAAGSRADALVRVKPARELFREKWPGYVFGNISSLMNTSFTTDDINLDETGRGSITVENQWEDVTSPHWVTANVSLYDSGGRPVVRSRSWQVWPAPGLVGIRNLTATEDDPGNVPEDSNAGFEVILADKTGQRLAGQGLKVTVIREHREYYWEFRNGEWTWGMNRQFFPVDRRTLDIPENGSSRISFPVKWGGYRLEVFNPETGLTSAREIWAGWRPEDKGQSAMNRPDRVDLALDKPAYRAGDNARVTVKAPQGGKGYLFVEGDTNLLTLPIDLPAGGKAFDIHIDPSWQRHDLYISALVVRPGERREARLPKRFVGLAPLPLDRSDRKLAVSIQAPEKTEPNQRLQVPVTLALPDGSIPRDAWVTLAAVDLGVLNLTGFKTPSPHDYFFRTRAYGVALQDIYQRLIEANGGSDARQRFGGDAPALTRGGDRPSTDVQIVALHQKAVKADDQGTVVFNLDLPDFNGSLRLMAVAHTKRDYGSSGKEMVLASPLVVQATMPRFLAFGDRAELLLELHNLTGAAQTLDLDTEIFGPARIENSVAQTLALAPGAKTRVRLPLVAGARSGRANITCNVSGLRVDGESRTVTKNWFIETRPAYPPMTQVWKQRVAPGTAFTLDPKALRNLAPDTVNVQAGMGAEPPINLADHVSRLMAYPYGCLEQTVSGLFPHVLLSSDDFKRLGLKTHTPEETRNKIRLGIQRLLEKQKSSGGFGLWSARSPESAWLTAYAVHFFINADAAGFEVPESALTKAFKRLVTYVRRPGNIPVAGYVDRSAYRAAVRAYAAFALARIQTLGLGDARSVFNYVKKNGKSPLGLVQAGLALGLAGDVHTASQAFDLAIKTSRAGSAYIGDYGSDVRDFAAAYYFLAAYVPEYRNKALFLHELDAALKEREWLSTQERNALVMAGAVNFSAQGAPWQAEVAVGSRKDTMAGKRPAQAVFTRGVAAKGFGIKNTGERDLYVDVVLSGYPNTLPPARSRGVSIARRFLDTRGNPVDVSTAAAGDRLIVELRVKPEKRMPHALVVDMLPAGLELEDPNLSGAFLINDIPVDKKTVREWHSRYTTAHTEYRDDRFVAALDIRAGRTCRVFYGVRVVSPGRFTVPPSLVEDMYRPYVRGIGATVRQMDVTAR